MSVNAKHATWREILDRIEHPEAAPADRHIAACPECKQRLAEARALLETLHACRLPDPPPAAVEKAMARLVAELAGDGQASGARAWAAWLVATLERGGAQLAAVTATLVADSLQPSPQLRGAVVAAPRMLRYETDEYAVAIAVTPDRSGDRCDLRGQVSPRQGTDLPSGGRVALARRGGVAESALSAHGEFLLEAVPQSASDLRIAIGDMLIKVEIPQRPA
jgi:hypothetical protein